MATTKIGQFRNTKYNPDKYAKMLAICGLINDKARFDFYKPINSLCIYQKQVRRIKNLSE